MLLEIPALYSWKFPFNVTFQLDVLLWKKWPCCRIFFIDYIIERQVALNLSKEELIAIFGEGRNEDHWDLVSYDIPTPFYTPHKKKLNFYFRDKKVYRVVLKFRRKVLAKRK